ncbi:unannotated protein [freshwater metagenome]|uniref:Unannotated protein n=1 Tax=freshwater metagenome TaxID=449393 RepID=A0A6J5Z0R3_9ZZZZ
MMKSSGAFVLMMENNSVSPEAVRFIVGRDALIETERAEPISKPKSPLAVCE